VSVISDHQQSWVYEDGPWKGPGPPLLVAADYLKRILERNTFEKRPLSLEYFRDIF